MQRRLERGERLQRGLDVGRLGIVDVAHATQLAHLLEPVRRRREGAQRVGGAVLAGAEGAGHSDGAGRVGAVVRAAQARCREGVLERPEVGTRDAQPRPWPGMRRRGPRRRRRRRTERRCRPRAGARTRAAWPRRRLANVAWRSRWSGVTLSSTPTSQRKRSTPSSWKLESSHTIVRPGSMRPANDDSAVPTLPALTLGTPPRSSMAAVSSVVVVLPFVPVMPTIGLRSSSRRYASSTSAHTGIPAERAARTIAASSGTPGLLTSRSAPASSSGSSRPSTASTPAGASPASGRRSASTTCRCGAQRVSASAAAMPERTAPSTTARRAPASVPSIRCTG